MRSARALAATALLLLAAMPARAHVGSHEVAVRDGYYDPQELRVDVGETVTWNVLHGGHTITADDGRFDFPADRLTRQGDRFEWTFTEDETFSYHCKVHKSFMFGVIVVGKGSPPKPPSGDPPEVRTVPGTHPTIRSAIETAPDDTIVEVAPGTYREPIQIDVPGLTLRGMGASPSDVRLDGTGQAGIGIVITASRVTIENILVTRHSFAGVFADGADRFTVDRVFLDANGRYGVRAVGVTGGTIRDSRATSSQRAGISVEGCVSCDVLVDRVLAENNLAGVAATNASNVVVRGSTLRNNGTGVALKSFPATEGMPQRGAHVYGNLIADNMLLPGIRPPVTDSFEIPTGTGVWVSGGAFDVIQSNTIRGHLYNIAVTGFTGPSIASKVLGNIVSGAREADLAWDGLGANVCFAGNTDPAGAPPTSAPARAEALYNCGLPATVGIPYPLVDAVIVQHGR